MSVPSARPIFPIVMFSSEKLVLSSDDAFEFQIVARAPGLLRQIFVDQYGRISSVTLGDALLFSSPGAYDDIHPDTLKEVVWEAYWHAGEPLKVKVRNVCLHMTHISVAATMRRRDDR